MLDSSFLTVSETIFSTLKIYAGRARLKLDGTRAETRFHLSPKRTSPFKSAGESVWLTSGSRGVHISVSNAGYTMFWSSVRVLATHSIRQFALHFLSRASPCAIRFQTSYTWNIRFYTHTKRVVKLGSEPDPIISMFQQTAVCQNFFKHSERLVRIWFPSVLIHCLEK
jgi:hypothetical protein